MRIFAFAIGARDRASSRWRLWDHLEWLRSQGHEVRADSFGTPGAKKADARLLSRVVGRYLGWARDWLWADAILVQETMALWPLVLLRNFGKRRTLVFDFSDPIDRAGSGMKRRARQAMFRLFVSRADAIMIENGVYRGLLGEHGKKVTHFYGPIDVTRFRAEVDHHRQPASTDRPLRIGWTGSHGTVSFIRPLLPMIDELARERPIEVTFVGVPSLDHGLEHATARIVPFDETADFRNVPTFDLALFRLEDTEDALWRGGGKLFIYMSGGAPFIATDRGIASDLMRDAGVGFAVASEGDWPAVLRKAIDDGAARDAMSARSLEYAREHLSYEEYRRTLLGLLAPARAGTPRAA